jgi:NAD(P)-dependent dehydrogenase (short-subunit alcohol dehydrogenase family)
MRLRDKVCVITGGAAGIGFADARRFLAEGARVVIADIVDPAPAAKTLASADRVLARQADVADAAAMRGLAEAYVTSKGAVVAMTRALARELGDSGITVNAVAPGLILSDTVQANPAITGFQADAVMRARSLKRDAYPEDVEGTVVFLASDESAFMSGQTLVVDGGSVFSTL